LSLLLVETTRSVYPADIFESSAVLLITDTAQFPKSAAFASAGKALSTAPRSSTALNILATILFVLCFMLFSFLF
jgi:hypothetical protein